LKKVLIIQNIIPHYRKKLYCELSKIFHLTVLHSGEKVSESNLGFKQLIVDRYKLGPFYWQYGVKSLTKEFDVIIVMFDIKWLSTLNLILSKRRKSQRIYLWGIGVSSQSGLNQNNTFDALRFWIARKSDGIIFYSDYPKAIYEKNNIESFKLFTSHNTLQVLFDKKKYSKKFENFLFIGSLHARKKVNDLIDAYALYKSETVEYKKLQIIGSGAEEENLKHQVYRLGLSNDIIFLGKILDEQIKVKFFEKAIAVICPGQAGLSVLESMAYGVPYVTYENAVTGGEAFNIEDGINGFIVKTKEDLVKIMLKMSADKEMLQRLSENALLHYNNNRKIEDMANSFKNIILKS
jgi:glycosyltransferase involved in cell wall biosynthesis